MFKKNGFSLPPNKYQISTWLILVWHTALPLLFHSSSSTLLIPFYSLYYLSLLLFTITGFILTKSNPSLNSDKSPYHCTTEENYNYYCTLCKNYIIKEARHCGKCNKCILGFDHHCVWLNNCIGSKNYKTFITVILLLVVNEAVLLIFEAILINQPSYHRNGILISDLLLNSIIFVFTVYLSLFHLYLKIIGKTTYEYLKLKKITPVDVNKKEYEFHENCDKVNLVQRSSSQDFPNSMFSTASKDFLPYPTKSQLFRTNSTAL